MPAMDRREFLAKAGLLATWSLVAVSVSDCSDDDSPAGPGGSGGETGVVAVAAGHSHSGATITAVQLEAGAALTLTLTGAGHTHTVDLTGEQVTDIADGLQVVVASSDDGGHSHTVTFN